uniref:Uncharacterized protein n=1 Tax=uncultured marine group II/III euryarchaeote KM3_149_F06 TaxID=1457885 RepID=A0A075GD06_9EURY|nr:hypothetical protein [uncultured marine group II/III euryarchaeote KM3_149_F06]
MLERVTSEILAESFLSDDFQKNLIKAGRITKRTGNETGFLIDIDVNNGKISSRNVIEGTYLGLDGRTVNDRQDNSTLNSICLGDLHFHPHVTGPVVPSESDLHLATFREESNVYVKEKDNYFNLKVNPICAIGKAREKGDVELLIYNANLKLHDGHIARVNGELENYLEENWVGHDEEALCKSDIKTFEIREILEDSGCYNAEILRFPANIQFPERRYIIRESNLEKFRNKLEKFEFDINYSKSDTSFLDSL